MIKPYFKEMHVGYTFELYHGSKGHDCCKHMLLKKGRKKIMEGAIATETADILTRTWKGGVEVLAKKK